MSFSSWNFRTSLFSITCNFLNWYNISVVFGWYWCGIGVALLWYCCGIVVVLVWYRCSIGMYCSDIEAILVWYENSNEFNLRKIFFRASWLAQKFIDVTLSQISVFIRKIKFKLAYFKNRPLVDFNCGLFHLRQAIILRK